MYKINQVSTRRVRALIAIVTLAGLFASMGCSSSSSPSGPGGGGNPQFTPKNAQINVGDTVKWVGVSGSHTVTSGTGSSDPTIGSLFDQQLPVGQTFTHVFDAAGVISYFCRPHEATGMKGTVTVTSVAPKTVQVSASGASFSPASIAIHVGDTVKWTSTGSHTVTSGTGSSDPNVGDLFDHAFSSGQTFTFVFSSTGTFPYFCRPHEGLGMKGTVIVTAVKPKTVQVNATT